MLEVVQHQQEVLVVQRTLQSFQRRSLSTVLDSQDRSNGGSNQGGIDKGSQRDKEDAVLEGVETHGGHLQREPSLAAPSRSG
jgi:hypothetical protein